MAFSDAENNLSRQTFKNGKIRVSLRREPEGLAFNSEGIQRLTS